VGAVGLDETMVRLDRMKLGQSPLPVLVTVKTGRNVADDGLKLTVGTAWTVAEPIISTNNLPTGVVAWPGIGVESVSDRTINFSSTDLSSDVLYGFYITGGISDNPAVATDMAEKWMVETLSGGVVDASREVKTPLTTSDQITVTGKVVPKATDFQLVLAVTPDGILEQDKQIDYEITYGSLLPYSVRPMVITASWTQGTIEGSPIATVDGLEYVIGSGGTAYGGAIPVIDLNNRTIAWTINSFPINLQDQKINFSLKTNNNYSGSSKVSYLVSTDLSGANVITVSDQKTLEYRYQIPAIPSPTPTSIPPTGGPGGATATAIPTSKPAEKIKIDRVGMVTLSSSAVQIKVNTNVQPDTIRIRYGNSVSFLNQSLTSVNKLKSDLLKLDQLKPGNDYYFVVEANKGSQRVISDMFTFRTPEVDSTAEVILDSVLVTSHDVIIADAADENTIGAEVVIQTGQVYSIKLDLKKPKEIKTAKVVVRNSRVLGIISVIGAEPNSTENNLMEIGKNGGHFGQLVSPGFPGYYEMYVIIEDIFGGIKEQKVGNLKTVKPIRVLDAKGVPVEGARIFFSKYNENSAVYQPLPSQIRGLINPSFSEADGILAIPLPKGGYRMEVSAISYQDESVDFNVGMGGAEGFPEVRLDKKPFSVLTKMSEYGQIMTDVFKYNRVYYNDLSKSGRFFNLVEMFQVIVSLLLVLMMVGRWNGIGWLMVPWWLLSQRKNDRLGKVVDGLTKKRIAGAVIYIGKDKVRTDKLGEFDCETKATKEKVIFKVLAPGYFSKTIEYSAEALNMGNLVVELERIDDGNQNVRLWKKELFELVGGMTVMVFLIWQVLFFYKMASMVVWPYLLLAMFNVIIWSMIVLKIERKNVV